MTNPSHSAIALLLETAGESEENILAVAKGTIHSKYLLEMFPSAFNVSTNHIRLDSLIPRLIYGLDEELMSDVENGPYQTAIYKFLDSFVGQWDEIEESTNIIKELLVQSYPILENMPWDVEYALRGSKAAQRQSSLLDMLDAETLQRTLYNISIIFSCFPFLQKGLLSEEIFITRLEPYVFLYRFTKEQDAIKQAAFPTDLDF